jgi:uncharacterized RDD family membrane protein YckC
LLALVGVLGRAVGVLPTEVTTQAARVVAQLAGIAVLTLPVTLWFAGWEAGPGGATPGKRVLRLGVVTTGGERLGLSRSLLRTALKFTLVWELAHTAVWNMLAWPGDGGSVVDMVLLGVANAVIVVDLVSLFVGTRRTPYDRITAPWSRPPDDAVGVATQPSQPAKGRPVSSIAAARGLTYLGQDVLGHDLGGGRWPPTMTGPPSRCFPFLMGGPSSPRRLLPQRWPPSTRGTIRETDPGHTNHTQQLSAPPTAAKATGPDQPGHDLRLEY